MNNVNILQHEVHLTVENTVTDNKFIEICKNANIKPIIFDLHLPIARYHKRYRRDMMTSTLIHGTFENVISASTQLRSYLEGAGLNVIREKVEVAPTPQSIEVYSHVNGYYETHIKVDMSKYSAQCLRRILDENKYYKSQIVDNAKRKKNTLTITFRRYRILDIESLDIFDKMITNVRQKLNRNDILESKKKEIEYCIYDTNLAHDNIWVDRKIK